MTQPPAGPEQIVTHFDTLHVDEDPWSVRSSWYERRKAAVLLSSLPQQHYRLAWEPGCSVGGLTSLLAERCDRVIAGDPSPRALAIARRALAPLANVLLREELVPRDKPSIVPGAADLVVLGEFLYYLPVHEVPAVLDIAARLQPPGGHLVVVHWRPQPEDGYQSGVQANAQVAADARWLPLVHHDDEHFVLDIGRRR